MENPELPEPKKEKDKREQTTE